ncbi:hypothetical protein [Paenibacillus methanolicus]|uniref:Uncharacterized protein n=1 Tax=Paenibacillus methanolicus TaxID=582686 RepID=A0A5S5BLU7_9BACL|nr:hypothetical protein [Paenibacillus methanolicus]TYP68047.1 hypothetical protein BCM02_1206 [Paenibacillus methanolicus]
MINAVELRNVLIPYAEKELADEESLERWLRALLVQLGQHRDRQPSFEDLASSIRRCLETEPHPYEPGWELGKPPAKEDARGDYEDAERILHFQISDLRKMEQAEQRHREHFLGTTSRMTHLWNNLDPASYIAGAASGLAAEYGIEPDCGWAGIARFLELGRIYEA